MDQSTIKLYGPCEYIAELSLNDFRQFGETLEERIEKLKEKIKQASGKTLESKLKVIEAFKKSEPFKLYLKTAKEALIQNKTIDQIIEEKKNQGEIYLKRKEFDKIIELRQNLSEILQF